MATATCNFNVSITIGQTVTPDIFSNNPACFLNQLPGVYNVFYVRGALKYNAAQGWALGCRDLNPNSGYWVTYNGGANQVEFNGTENPTFPSQAAVEAANAGKFTQVVHNGGNICVYLSDDPAIDNVAGNPNPTFGLAKVG